MVFTITESYRQILLFTVVTVFMIVSRVHADTITLQVSGHYPDVYTLKQIKSLLLKEASDQALEKSVSYIEKTMTLERSFSVKDFKLQAAVVQQAITDSQIEYSNDTIHMVLTVATRIDETVLQDKIKHHLATTRLEERLTNETIINDHFASGKFDIKNYDINAHKRLTTVDIQHAQRETVKQIEQDLENIDFAYDALITPSLFVAGIEKVEPYIVDGKQYLSVLFYFHSTDPNWEKNYTPKMSFEFTAKWVGLKLGLPYEQFYVTGIPTDRDVYSDLKAKLSVLQLRADNHPFGGVPRYKYRLKSNKDRWPPDHWLPETTGSLETLTRQKASLRYALSQQVGLRFTVNAQHYFLPLSCKSSKGGIWLYKALADDIQYNCQKEPETGWQVQGRRLLLPYDGKRDISVTVKQIRRSNKA